MMAPLPDQDNADHATAVERLRRRVKLLGIDARHQHIEALVGERVRQAAQHAEKEWIGQMLARVRIVGNNHANSAILLQA